jgi:hypothetical protein
VLEVIALRIRSNMACAHRSVQANLGVCMSDRHQPLKTSPDPPPLQAPVWKWAEGSYAVYLPKGACKLAPRRERPSSACARPRRRHYGPSLTPAPCRHLLVNILGVLAPRMPRKAHDRVRCGGASDGAHSQLSALLVHGLPRSLCAAFSC